MNPLHRPTPIPTPGWVRLLGSALFATAVAILASQVEIPIAAITALLAVVAALAVTLCHPYRRELRDFAERHNVTMLPSVGQILPLFLLWLGVMLAPLFALPQWGTALVWLGVFIACFLLYPHVDGSRKLAYANNA